MRYGLLLGDWWDFFSWDASNNHRRKPPRDVASSRDAVPAEEEGKEPVKNPGPAPQAHGSGADVVLTPYPDARPAAA